MFALAVVVLALALNDVEARKKRGRGGGGGGGGKRKKWFGPVTSETECESTQGKEVHKFRQKKPSEMCRDVRRRFFLWQYAKLRTRILPDLDTHVLVVTAISFFPFHIQATTELCFCVSGGGRKRGGRGRKGKNKAAAGKKFKYVCSTCELSWRFRKAFKRGASNQVDEEDDEQ